MSGDPKPEFAVYRRTLARALQKADPGSLLLHFHAQVLQRPLAATGAKLLRSDTIGRLMVPGKTTVDFGIVEGEQVIHLRFQDLLTLLPESDRDHWLDHLVPPTHSRVLLQMHANPASCHDDGPIREWAPPSDGAG